MTSPSAQAREKRTRSRGEDSLVRPATEHPNSPLPHYGYAVQHALYPSLQTVLRTMWSLKPAQLRNSEDSILNDASITRLSQATKRFTNQLSDALGEPMPRRTVAHCLDALVEKGFIERWEVESRAKTSPKGTSYRIRRWGEVLQSWRDNPDIASVTTASGKYAFYYRGKGRSFMTPPEAVAWGVPNLVMVEKKAAAVVGPTESSIMTATGMLIPRCR